MNRRQKRAGWKITTDVNGKRWWHRGDFKSTEYYLGVLERTGGKCLMDVKDDRLAAFEIVQMGEFIKGNRKLYRQHGKFVADWILASKSQKQFANRLQMLTDEMNRLRGQHAVSV